MEGSTLSLLTLFLYMVIIPDQILAAENSTETLTTLRYGDLEITLLFEPERVKQLVVGNTANVTCTYSVNRMTVKGGGGGRNTSDLGVLDVLLRSDSPEIASVEGTSAFKLTIDDERVAGGHTFNFTILAKFLGYAKINMYVSRISGNPAKDIDWFTENNFTQDSLNVSYRVSVIRPLRIIDIFFRVATIAMSTLLLVLVGSQVDLPGLKLGLKRPVAPAIGMFCQYIIMPLTAFGLLKAFGFQGGMAVGFLAVGSSPGGNSSNIFTYLFGGDLSLSVLMTTVSTFASVAMYPLWMFTLGQLLVEEGDQIVTPYGNIMMTQSGILIPILIGMIIRWKRPAWAVNMKKALNVVIIIFLLFTGPVGVYSNIFIFKVITVKILLAGMLLPYTGFFLGGLIALFTGQEKKKIIAIMIETGLQNPAIAMLTMISSYPQPSSDLSLVPIMVLLMFSPLPLIVGLLVRLIYIKCCKKGEVPHHLVPTEDCNGNDDGKLSTGMKMDLDTCIKQPL